MPAGTSVTNGLMINNDYLNNPIAAGCEDKRLEIDLEQLRQDIWEFPDGTPKDFKEEDERDRCIWIDTSVMLADCLTKWSKSKVDKTNKQKFIQFLQDGVLNFEQDAEAKMQKIYQSAQRRKAKDKKNASSEITDAEVSNPSKDRSY